MSRVIKLPETFAGRVGLGTAAASMIACLGLPHLIDDSPERQAQEIAALQYEAEVASGARDEAAHNQDRVQTALGDACIGLVSPYLGDGPLAEVSEDSVVQDIYTSGRFDCGEEPTQIRIAVNGLREQHDLVESANSRAQTLNGSLEMDIQNVVEEYQESEIKNALASVVFSPIFGGFGGFMGWIISDAVRLTRKPKRESE